MENWSNINRKTIVFMVLLLLVGSSTMSQTYFNRLYTNDATSSVYRGICPRGTGWMIAARVQDSTTGKIGIRSIRMNAEGEIQASGFFVLPDYPTRDADPVSKGICAIDNNHYVVYGVVGIDPPSAAGTQYSFLLMVDSNGQSLKYRDYKKPYCTDKDSFFYNAEVKYDGQGHLIMAGHLSCSTTVHFYKYLVSKFDTGLNLIWSKTYEYGYNERTLFALAVDTTGYTLAGVLESEASSSSTLYKSNATLFKTDTAGNLLWTYSTPSGQWYAPITSVLHTRDGGYAFSTMGHAINAAKPGAISLDLQSKPLIVKLDSNRNLLWEVELSDRYSGFGLSYWKLLELPDSSIAVTRAYSDYNDSGKSTFIYALLNRYKANGSLMWKRKYRIPLDNPIVLSGISIDDMCYTDEHCFVIAGYIGNNKADAVAPKERGWLIKVDSNGCETSGIPCNPSKIPTLIGTQASIHIYPNPSSTYYEIEYSNEDHSPTSISITDLSGRALVQYPLPQGKSRIEAQAWASGMYFYSIQQSGKTLYNGKLIKQ